MLPVVLEGASMVCRRQLKRRCESRNAIAIEHGSRKEEWVVGGYVARMVASGSLGIVVAFSIGWVGRYSRCDREICLVLNLSQIESLPSTVLCDP